MALSSLSIPNILASSTSSISSTSTSSSPSSTSSSVSSSTSSTTSSSSTTSTSTTSSTPTSTSTSSSSSSLSTSSTSSTSSPPSTLTSSSRSSSSSSLLTTTSPSNTLTSPTPLESFTSFVSTESNGAVVTVTLTPTATAVNGGTNASDRSSTNTGFFSNTGEVAGVFTVVGLVVLALIIALLTNAIRRRRARKFDEDVAIAAAEAAKSPRYPFDEYDDPSGGGADYTSAWSDHGSSGAYNQPPLQPGKSEYYNMNELPISGLGPGAAYGMSGDSRYPRPSFGTDASGPGIAGLGANSGNENRAGLGAPYNAFAVPGAPVNGETQYDPFSGNNGVNNGLQRSGSQTSRDLLEAAGIAGAGAAGGAYLTRGLSQNTNLSNPGSGISKESYANHYRPDFQPEAYTYTGTTGTPGSLTSPPSTGSMPNPHSPSLAAPSPPQQTEYNYDDAYADETYFPPPQPIHGDIEPEDSRRSLRDEDDYGLRARVLRVANE